MKTTDKTDNYVSLDFKTFMFINAHTDVLVFRIELLRFLQGTKLQRKKSINFEIDRTILTCQN